MTDITDPVDPMGDPDGDDCYETIETPTGEDAARRLAALVARLAADPAVLQVMLNDPQLNAVLDEHFPGGVHAVPSRTSALLGK